jgi:2-methylaconitate cis-trans-isomerase PrpF
MEAHQDLLQHLEIIRRQLQWLWDSLTKDTASVLGSIPRIVVVSPLITHTIISGSTLVKEDVDLVVGAISVGQPHCAMPITVAMAVAAAANLEGSVVNRVLGETRTCSDGIALGHSGGKIVVGATFKDSQLTNATIYRIARRLMDGIVY